MYISNAAGKQDGTAVESRPQDSTELEETAEVSTKTKPTKLTQSSDLNTRPQYFWDYFHQKGILSILPINKNKFLKYSHHAPVHYKFYLLNTY